MKLYIRVLLAMMAIVVLQGCISAKSAPAEQAEAAAPAPAPVLAAVAAPIGDSDGDGVNDDLDQCPNTRPGVEVDAKGCEILYRFTGPLFDFDKSDLTPRAQELLMQAVAVLKRNPGKQIEVAGHTDSVGSDQYNQKLGERRALAVMNFLGANRVNVNRLVAVSYGESQPVETNETKQGRSQNRRVELIDTTN